MTQSVIHLRILPCCSAAKNDCCGNLLSQSLLSLYYCYDRMEQNQESEVGRLHGSATHVWFDHHVIEFVNGDSQPQALAGVSFNGDLSITRSSRPYICADHLLMGADTRPQPFYAGGKFSGRLDTSDNIPGWKTLRVLLCVPFRHHCRWQLHVDPCHSTTTAPHKPISLSC